MKILYFIRDAINKHSPSITLAFVILISAILIFILSNDSEAKFGAMFLAIFASGMASSNVIDFIFDIIDKRVGNVSKGID